MKTTLVNFFNNLKKYVVVPEARLSSTLEIFKNEENMSTLAEAFDIAIMSDENFADDMVAFMKENKEQFKFTDADLEASRNWLLVARQIPQEEYRIKFITNRLNNELNHELGYNDFSDEFKSMLRGEKFDELFEEYMKLDDYDLMKDNVDNSKVCQIGKVARRGNIAIDKLEAAHRLSPEEAYMLRRKFDAYCVEGSRPAYAIMHTACEMALIYVA